MNTRAAFSFTTYDDNYVISTVGMEKDYAKVTSSEQGLTNLLNTLEIAGVEEDTYLEDLLELETTTSTSIVLPLTTLAIFLNFEVLNYL